VTASSYHAPALLTRTERSIVRRHGYATKDAIATAAVASRAATAKTTIRAAMIPSIATYAAGAREFRLKTARARGCFDWVEH